MTTREQYTAVSDILHLYSPTFGRANCVSVLIESISRAAECLPLFPDVCGIKKYASQSTNPFAGFKMSQMECTWRRQMRSTPARRSASSLDSSGLVQRHSTRVIFIFWSRDLVF